MICNCSNGNSGDKLELPHAGGGGEAREDYVYNLINSYLVRLSIRVVHSCPCLSNVRACSMRATHEARSAEFAEQEGSNQLGLLTPRGLHPHGLAYAKCAVHSALATPWPAPKALGGVTRPSGTAAMLILASTRTPLCLMLASVVAAICAPSPASGSRWLPQCALWAGAVNPLVASQLGPRVSAPVVSGPLTPKATSPYCPLPLRTGARHCPNPNFLLPTPGRIDLPPLRTRHGIICFLFGRCPLGGWAPASKQIFPGAAPCGSLARRRHPSRNYNRTG